MKFLVLILCLVLGSAFSFKANTEPLSSLKQELQDPKHKRYRVNANQTYYSEVFDTGHNIKRSNVDLEFDLAGVDIYLKGYSQDRARPDYYEKLIYPGDNP